MMDMAVIRGCLGKVGRKCEDGEVESRAKKRCLCLFINHAVGTRSCVRRRLQPRHRGEGFGSWHQGFPWRRSVGDDGGGYLGRLGSR